MSDRLDLLLAQQQRYTGIDFVNVVDPCDQRVLRIYFVTDPRELDTLFSLVAVPPPNAANPVVPLTPASFIIDSPLTDIEPIAVDASAGVKWVFDSAACRMYVELTLVQAGQFGAYTLTIVDPYASASEPSRIDPYFNHITFNFKAGCDDGFDCDVAPPLGCPPEADDNREIDFLARDFSSLRGGLIDFARQRLPDWHTPIAADPLVMLIEVLAALGDEHAYMQDRYAREAHLATATQRRSVRKLARLVDYEIHDGRLASSDLLVKVEGPGLLVVPNGTRVWALSAAGPRIPFEVGRGLWDETDYAVRQGWNLGEVQPFYWQDEKARVLHCGATELLVEGPVSDVQLWRGRKLLFEVPAEADGAGTKRRRHLARVQDVVQDNGGYTFHDPIAGVDYHRIVLHPDDALPFDVPLDRVRLGANLVPATAGETRYALVRCGPRQPADPTWLHSTVQREGPTPPGAAEDNTGYGPIRRTAERDDSDDGIAAASASRPTIHYYSLPGSDDEGLGFLGAKLRDTVPELQLRQVLAGAVGSLPAEPGPVAEGLLEAGFWDYRARLITSGEQDNHFTLEDGTWRRVVGYPDATGEEVVHRDYASGGGYSLRFGDGRHGRVPQPGQVFYVRYRTGVGASANVAADTIRALALPEQPGSGNAPAFMVGVSNPMAVADGVDREAMETAKMLAPEAWQSHKEFAVRPDDYAEQSQRLSWVQRGHATMRWTGSWPSVFVATDPRGATTLSAGRRQRLADHLDCVRQVNREVMIRQPRYLALDLRIHLCLEPGAYAGQVREAVRQRLVGEARGDRPLPFFHPDRFTFGTPVRRAALESAIHSVLGVRSVLSIDIAARGVQPLSPFEGQHYPPDGESGNYVILLDANANMPHRGTLRITAEGGA